MQWLQLQLELTSEEGLKMHHLFSSQINTSTVVGKRIGSGWLVIHVRLGGGSIGVFWLRQVKGLVSDLQPGSGNCFQSYNTLYPHTGYYLVQCALLSMELSRSSTFYLLGRLNKFNVALNSMGIKLILKCFDTLTSENPSTYSLGVN